MSAYVCVSIYVVCELSLWLILFVWFSFDCFILFRLACFFFFKFYCIVIHFFFDCSLFSSEGESTMKDVDLGGWGGSGRSWHTRTIIRIFV